METLISSVRANIPRAIGGPQMGGPAVQLADAIRQGRPVMALLGVDTAPVSAALGECIGLLLDAPVRVIRIHGLPGVPLSLPRMVEELGASQHEGQPADDDELIVRVLARRSDQETQVALIIEQAELLPSRTLAFLQVALTVFGARTPRLQLIFAGQPKFEQLLLRGELAGLRERLEVVIHLARLPVSADPVEPGQAACTGISGRQRSARGLGRGAKALAALVTLLAVCAASFAITRRDTAQQARLMNGSAPAQVTQAAPTPTVTAALPPPQPQVLQAPAPPQPAPAEPSQTEAVVPPSSQGATPAPAAPHIERGAVPSGDQLTRLRGEFDRFLAQTEWGSKRLGEGERARLFNEYLRWNYGVAGAKAGSPP